MESKPTKNPQKVAWGKKLAEINRQIREEFKRLKRGKNTCRRRI